MPPKPSPRVSSAGAVSPLTAALGLALWMLPAPVQAGVSEAALRSAVSKRLGYDPFVAYASSTAVVHIETEGAQVRARTYLDRGGVAEGAREFRSGLASCNDIVAAVALALSIALDPMQASDAASGESAQEGASTSGASPIGDAPARGSSATAVAEGTRAPLTTRDQPSGSLPSSRAAAPIRTSFGAGFFTSFGTLPKTSTAL